MQMAGLYRACDCAVQPYRGEGFCLPVAEAMGKLSYDHDQDILGRAEL